MEKQGGKARMGAGWVGGERGESNRCEGIAVGRVLQLGEQARKKLAGERGRRERRDTIGSGGHALAKPHLTQLAHHIEGRGHALIRQGEETGVIGFEGGRGSAPHKLRNNLSTGASLLVDAEKLLRVLQLQHPSSQ